MTLNTSCERCSAPIRLIGSERHERLPDTELWTFECTQCGHFAVTAHPLGSSGTTPARNAVIPVR